MSAKEADATGLAPTRMQPLPFGYVNDSDSLHTVFELFPSDDGHDHFSTSSSTSSGSSSYSTVPATINNIPSLSPGTSPPRFEDTDVLIGRHQFCRKHSGNRRLKNLIMERLSTHATADAKTDYLSAGKRSKEVINLEVFQKIKTSNGRFLRCDKTRGWFEVSNRAARTFIAQQFRQHRGMNDDKNKKRGLHDTTATTDEEAPSISSIEHGFRPQDRQGRNKKMPAPNAGITTSPTTASEQRLPKEDPQSLLLDESIALLDSMDDVSLHSIVLDDDEVRFLLDDDPLEIVDKKNHVDDDDDAHDYKNNLPPSSSRPSSKRAFAHMDGDSYVDRTQPSLDMTGTAELKKREHEQSPVLKKRKRSSDDPSTTIPFLPPRMEAPPLEGDGGEDMKQQLVASDLSHTTEAEQEKKQREEEAQFEHLLLLEDLDYPSTSTRTTAIRPFAESQLSAIQTWLSSRLTTLISELLQGETFLSMLRSIVQEPIPEAVHTALMSQGSDFVLRQPSSHDVTPPPRRTQMEQSPCRGGRAQHQAQVPVSRAWFQPSPPLAEEVAETDESVHDDGELPGIV